MATIEKRQNGDGTVTFRVKVRLRGHPAQNASFSRLTDAKRWATQTEAAMREGRHFKTVEARRHTVSELIDRYDKDIVSGKVGRTKGVYPPILMWWREEIGFKTLADITPALIVSCRDKLSETRQPATVQKYMVIMGHAFNLAVREWNWLEINPFSKVSKPSLPRGRTRFLSDDERGRLLSACRASSNPLLYPVVVLALSTGMRQAEIMNLYWREPQNPPHGAWGVVHLIDGKIILHSTKNGDRRVVPLVGHSAECLKGLVRHINTDLLFPSPHTPKPGKSIKPIDLRTPWETALRRAEVSDFRFHDLRHSCASYLTMNGASMAEVAEVLGHKTLAMVKRYSHLSEAHTTAVVRKLDERLFQ